MRKIIVGTVADRHDMPVEDYVFKKQITDPNDYKYLEDVSFRYLREKVRPYGTMNPEVKPISCIDPSNMLWLESDIELEIYTTGLSQALIAIINSARRLHIHNITICHYDTDIKDYKKQKLVY